MRFSNRLLPKTSGGRFLAGGKEFAWHRPTTLVWDSLLCPNISFVPGIKIIKGPVSLCKNCLCQLARFVATNCICSMVPTTATATEEAGGSGMNTLLIILMIVAAISLVICASSCSYLVYRVRKFVTWKTPQSRTSFQGKWEIFDI